MTTNHSSTHQTSVSTRRRPWPLLACLAALAWLPVACAEPPLKPGDPADIVAAIQKEQKQEVRESYGEFASECFTVADLASFEQAKTAEKVAAGMRAQRKFMEGILALSAKPGSEQNAFVAACRKPLRPTWAALGKVSAEGQTEAGQKAEIAIAKSVADLVEELVKLPDEKLQELFKKK